MSDLEKISIELKNIFDKKTPKIDHIEEVIKYIEIARNVYMNDKDNPYLVIEFNFLKYLEKYKSYLLIRKRMELETGFKRLDIEDEIIRDIDKLFLEIEYEKKFRKLTKYFDEKIIEEDNLSADDFKYFSLLIANQCFPNLPSCYVDYYFKLLLNHNHVPNIEAIKECIINLGKNELENLGIYCKIEFSNIDKKTTDGEYCEGRIILDNKLAEQFIVDNPKPNYRLFLTLFHEMRHAIQDDAINSGEYKDYLHLKMLKDKLISQYISFDYDKENYSRLSSEYDAFYMEKIMTKRYLDNIGINCFSSSDILIETSLYKGFLNTDNRFIRKRLLPIDIMFDLYFKEIMGKFLEERKQNIFEVYPVLKLIYHEDGTRKTSIELLKRWEESDDLKEKDNIDNILNNQIISYYEICTLLKHAGNKNEIYNPVIPAFVKRTKMSLRTFIDIFTYLSDKLNILNENMEYISEQLKNASHKK